MRSPPMTDAGELKMVRRHVRQGERHIVQQERVIRDLTQLGANTTLAKELLQVFQSTLAAHRAHLARLEAERP